MNPVADLVDRLITAASQNGPSAFSVGTIVGVVTAGADDGNDLVTVNILGTHARVTYGDHITPVVGHVVLLANTQPRAIICRLIGTPPV